MILIVSRGKASLLTQVNGIISGMVLELVMKRLSVATLGLLWSAKVWAAWYRGKDESRLTSPKIVNKSPLMEGENSAKIGLGR